MDKDLGIKVTRLRRRLSVESEDSNSPPAPSTPTKKRGGRLATKPQLELIDEDVNESVPKRTPRKSVAKDAVEAEEKVMTPARRITRNRSNTSLLAEVTAVTPKVTDSPRAMRAARRNSLLGSDNETHTPVAAPLRQTRRTRKNSTTSVDIILENDNETPVAKQTKKSTKNSTPSGNDKVTDAATEKESNTNSKSNENGDETSPTIRKSPRLKDKLEKKTPNKDRKSKGDGSIQLSKESPRSAETVNDGTSEKENLDHEITIPLTIDEKSVTSTVDSNKVNSEIDENEASKNVTLPVQTITNQDGTKEDEIAIKITQLNNSKLDIKEKLSISSYDEQYEKSDVEKLLEHDPRNMQSVVVIDDSDSNSGKLVMDIPNEGEDQCVPVVHSNQFVNDAPKAIEAPEPMDIDESIPLNVTLNDFEQFVKSTTDPVNNTTELSKNNSFELKGTAKANASNQSLNKSKRTSSVSVPSENINEKNDNKSKRTSSVSISLESSFQNIDVDGLNNSRRSSHSKINTSLQAQNKPSPESSKANLTLNEKLQKSRKSSIRCRNDETNSPTTINKSNRKSSKSLSENSKEKSPRTYENKNKSRNSSVNAENIDKHSENENQANKKSLLNEESEDSKSLTNIEDNCLNESSNKNKSSTTVAKADTQNLERSTNENKSTLVLSQLKDISSNDAKNNSKSPDELNNELSKSVTVTDIAKNDKNNITNVLTSTPLQPKCMQKLGMQINTSIISPNGGNKSVDMKVNKKSTPVAESSESDSSDEEDVVKNKSKMIDDEASEASEDYESGDSRDDDERQYEVENEILEKGETLESDKDFSNDSDYEKDSFVVSSDPEDDEMLSGTGNDLSLSDNELNMSKKSKKKFDERKRKEQKKASREMFEARHGLNKSNNDSKWDKVKSKKKAKQLESSESENETEKPKKNNRMRIDSSHDDIVLKDDIYGSIIGHKKKKTKRLSESICEDTTTINEKEITICNESISNKNDPLSAAIKLEPKTPQKDFNISAIPIVDKIEEVEVGDKTVINANETSDPLGTTIVQDEDSLSSENMEIMHSYDTVLKNLNDQRKVKSLDMSLDIENKSGAKKKPKEPIIDQLNLTQTKKDKKNKSVKKSEKKKNINVSKVVQDEESSDCIDMELLFPEESNDSEVNVNKTNQDNNTVMPAEEFIPLKKTEGKTHIPETMSTSANLNDSKLNKSKSKKEKKSSQADAGDSSETTDCLNFFVDVTGDFDLSSSKKKNKKKYFNEEQDIDSKSNSFIEDKDVLNVTVNDEAPTEVSFKSDKKKKKKHKHLNTSVNESIVAETELNNRWERREAEANSEDQIDSKEPDQLLNTSVKSDKKKKENKHLDVSNIEPPGVESDTQSAKKKSRKSLEKLVDDNVIINMGIEDTEIEPEKSFSSEKKKQKNKHNISTSDNTQDLAQITTQTVTDNSQFTEHNPENSDTLLKSEKKKKKKHHHHHQKDVSINDDTIYDQSLRLGELFGANTEEQTEDVSENTNNTSLKNEKKKKKKHENKDLVQDEQNVQPEQETTSLDPEVVTSSKKKKKHKIKDMTKLDEDSDDAPEEVSFKFEKATFEEINEQKAKKRKLETGEVQGPVQPEKSKKKRKLSDKVENPENEGDKNVPRKASKKRKRQEAGIELVEKRAKVSKQHSLDKIHIPRLPLSVLEQLDDEPQVPKKKTKAIATSEFIVEDARSRKNKPSTYLEQSVYLNDTPKKNKKKHKVKKNPVLPFMPTAETSDKGFTSNFRINVVSETPFVASNTGNFKNDYLAQQRIKKMGTFERFKTQRSHKLCKF